VLLLAIRFPQANGLVSLWWLVLAYFVLEVGELMLSPIGLSAVTQLSLPRVVSLMMGAWFLGTSYSEVLAAQLGKLSALERTPHAALDVGSAMAAYQGLFELLLWIGLGCGFILLLFTPLLRRGMHGLK
jgi:POT family proton-dependent oligopeptide transporter